MYVVRYVGGGVECIENTEPPNNFKFRSKHDRGRVM